MRVVVTGDFHGRLPKFEVPPCDLLLYTGDVGPPHFLDQFAIWLSRVEAAEIIGVAGNHDFSVEPLRELPWTFLQDETAVVDDLVVHGAPWSLPFNDWAWMRPESALEARWRLIPDDCDVLVVHGPPHGYGDLAARNVRTGSETLTIRIRELAKLKLVACGHIHEAYGVYPLNGGGPVLVGPHGAPEGSVVRSAPLPLVVNGAHVDEFYKPVNPPIVIDL